MVSIYSLSSQSIANGRYDNVLCGSHSKRWSGQNGHKGLDAIRLFGKSWSHHNYRNTGHDGTILSIIVSAFGECINAYSRR